MAPKKRNTMVILVCIIVLLVFIVMILSMATLPLMKSARENAFRIEANNVVKAVENVYKDSESGKYTIENASDVCKNENKICITIDRLTQDKYYNNANSSYKGKIEVSISDVQNPMFTLYLKKGAEFSFVGLNYTNYTDYGQINNASWLEEYETCNCETTE